MRNRLARRRTMTVPKFRRVATCGHMGCERQATDRSRGVPVCEGHFWVCLQREVGQRLAATR